MIPFLVALAAAATPAAVPPPAPSSSAAQPAVQVPSPLPAPRRRIVSGALQCAARVGLAHDEVAAREGDSATAQSLAKARDTLAVMAGKEALPTFADMLRTERAALTAQDSHRRLRRAMGIPDDPDPAREAALATCLDMTKPDNAESP